MGQKIDLPKAMYPPTEKLRYVENPRIGLTKAAQEGQSRTGRWMYDASLPREPGRRIPKSHGEGGDPNVFFHATGQEFESSELDYDSGERKGVFFTPNVATAGVYGGLTDSRAGDRKLKHWSGIPKSSRIIMANIDTEDMPKYTEIDQWLHERGVHPESKSSTNLKRSSTGSRRQTRWQNAGLSPFWDVGTELNPESVPERDLFWGRPTDYAIHHGASGIQYPDSLVDSFKRGDLISRVEEVGVHDPDHVTIRGETRPRYLFMDLDIHKEMVDARKKAEVVAGDECIDDVGELYAAIDAAEQCDPEQLDLGCSIEGSRLIVARRNVEGCLDNVGITQKWQPAVERAGGDRAFRELELAKLQYEIDPIVNQELRDRLFVKKDKAWPPPDYVDPSAAHESLSKSIETGYVAPRSEFKPKERGRFPSGSDAPLATKAAEAAEAAAVEARQAHQDANAAASALAGVPSQEGQMQQGQEQSNFRSVEDATVDLNTEGEGGGGPIIDSSDLAIGHPPVKNNQGQGGGVFPRQKPKEQSAYHRNRGRGGQEMRAAKRR